MMKNTEPLVQATSFPIPELGVHLSVHPEGQRALQEKQHPALEAENISEDLWQLKKAKADKHP